MWEEFSYNKFKNRKNEYVEDKELFVEELLDDICLFRYGLLESLTETCCMSVEDVYGLN